MSVRVICLILYFKFRKSISLLLMSEEGLFYYLSRGICPYKESLMQFWTEGQKRTFRKRSTPVIFVVENITYDGVVVKTHMKLKDITHTCDLSFLLSSCRYKTEKIKCFLIKRQHCFCWILFSPVDIGHKFPTLSWF